jgi:hypothetical protein
MGFDLDPEVSRQNLPRPPYPLTLRPEAPRKHLGKCCSPEIEQPLVEFASCGLTCTARACSWTCRRTVVEHVVSYSVLQRSWHNSMNYGLIPGRSSIVTLLAHVRVRSTFWTASSPHRLPGSVHITSWPTQVECGLWGSAWVPCILEFHTGNLVACMVCFKQS